MSSEDIVVSPPLNLVLLFLISQPGDIVAVNHGYHGRREGLVVNSYYDHAVSRQYSCTRHPSKTAMFRVDKFQPFYTFRIDVCQGIHLLHVFDELCPTPVHPLPNAPSSEESIGRAQSP